MSETAFEVFPDRASWLEGRRKGLGGSDVPAILGLSRWKTPLQVWSEKVGLVESDDATYSMERGSFLEPFIARRLASEAGLNVLEGAGTTAGTLGIATHPEFPCLRYSPDGVAWPSVGDGALGPAQFLVEFKSRTPYAREEWAEGAPADVVAQVQHGLDVMGLALAYVAVDLVTEFRWVKVPRDDAWIASTRPKLLAFWELVKSETPPAPTGSESDKAALAALYRRETDETVALPSALLDAAIELEELKATLAKGEERKRELENAVRAAIGEAARGLLPDGSGWTWKTTKMPERVLPPSEYRVLRRFKTKER